MPGVASWGYLNPWVTLNPFVEGDDATKRLPVSADLARHRAHRAAVAARRASSGSCCCTRCSASVRRRADAKRAAAWMAHTEQEARRKFEAEREKDERGNEERGDRGRRCRVGANLDRRPPHGRPTDRALRRRAGRGRARAHEHCGHRSGGTGRRRRVRREPDGERERRRRADAVRPTVPPTAPLEGPAHHAARPARHEQQQAPGSFIDTPRGGGRAPAPAAPPRRARRGEPGRRALRRRPEQRATRPRSTRWRASCSSGSRFATSRSRRSTHGGLLAGGTVRQATSARSTTSHGRPQARREAHDQRRGCRASGSGRS